MKGKVTDADGEGEQVILKACNRCARFLPVNIYSERDALGFSNHCVQRAPCTHGAFSQFRVQNWDEIEEVDPDLRTHLRQDGETAVVQTHHGFQLECRPCKKFEVNAPLNPLRNAAQRREDSLRRRAFEQLVMHLLGRDWIFYTYRQKHGKEFDTFIWERFGRQCFACGKELPTVEDMELDHTLPLNYLWPLDDTATCLCSTCNSQKHDLFPFEFAQYRAPGKLAELARITGLDPELLRGPVKRANPHVVKRLRERVVWFFDTFLSQKEYQKERHGKWTADLILVSLQDTLNETNAGYDLIEEYRAQTGTYPESVTLND